MPDASVLTKEPASPKNKVALLGVENSSQEERGMIPKEGEHAARAKQLPTPDRKPQWEEEGSLPCWARHPRHPAQGSARV